MKERWKRKHLGRLAPADKLARERTEECCKVPVLCVYDVV